MSKIRYIETKPIKQSIDFEDRNDEYREFIDKRLKEVIDYCYANNIKYQDYFSYYVVHINKDGSPRKEINPKWLHTKKAHKKQKKNWKIYCENRKKQTLEKSFRRKLAEIDFKIEYWLKEKEKLITEQENKMEKK